MGSDILYAFAIFQVTFLLLDIYVLTKTGRDITRKGEYVWFSVLIVTHMVYLCMNTLWTLQEYEALHIPRSILWAVCSVSLWTVTNCATSFFFFVVEKLRIRSLLEGPGQRLRLLPAIFSTVMIAANPWTKLVFSLDAGGHFIHEKMYLPVLAASSLYLVTVAVAAAINMLKAQTPAHRQSNGALFCSVLIIILYILLDGTMTQVSILPAAVFATIMVIFIVMQEANINSDALTGMNNRRKADDYLFDKLGSVSPAEPLYLYMGDLNGFKSINDTYGHLEGDEALIICSRVLKQTIGRYNGFAARFGGDEFLLAWQPGKGKESDPEMLVKDVAARLEVESATKPYELSMSIGYAICTDPGKSASAYIKEADAMLYQRKALAKQRR